MLEKSCGSKEPGELWREAFEASLENTITDLDKFHLLDALPDSCSALAPAKVRHAALFSTQKGQTMIAWVVAGTIGVLSLLTIIMLVLLLIKAKRYQRFS